MQLLLWVLLASAGVVLGHHLGDMQHAKMSPSESMVVMTEECDVTKACHVAPQGCYSDISTCLNAVTVTEEEGLYVFELMTTTGVWVAAGISANDHMGDTAVVECVFNNETNAVELFVSWNSPGDINDRVTTTPEENGVIMQESSYDNGFIYCKYTREPYTLLSNFSFDLIKTPYHLLLASGNNLKPNGVGVAEHDITNFGSPESQLFHEVGIFGNGASMLRIFSFLIPAQIMYVLYTMMTS